MPRAELPPGNTSNKKMRRSYSAWFDNASRNSTKLFNKYQIDSVDIATNQDYVQGLMGFFERR